MNKLRNTVKFSCLASVLACGIASADNPMTTVNNPCEGFQITLQNNLHNDIAVKTLKVHTSNATIQPGVGTKISQQTLATFTVNNVSSNAPVSFEIATDTISLPAKTFRMRGRLVNEGGMCTFIEDSQTGEIKGVPNVTPGKVTYSIN